MEYEGEGKNAGGKHRMEEIGFRDTVPSKPSRQEKERESNGRGV